jgi:hypothetical protein
MPGPNFIVNYINQQLTFDPPDPYHLDVVSSREPAIAEMVQSVIKKHDIREDFRLNVRVADGPWEMEMYTNYSPDPPAKELSNRLPETYYSFCVYNERYHKAFPDFMYVGQKETGNLNYTETVNAFIDTPPATNKIGWIGAANNGSGKIPPRTKYIRDICPKYPDTVEGIDLYLPLWDINGWKSCNARMSYQDQINRWKYLLDMEGFGWSARLKVLLSSPRIVFMVDRPYQEWFFEYLEPWKHYVPVKRDLSDIKENYDKIESDVILQEHIKKNQREFAKKYLTREAAENRIYEIIKEMVQYYKTHKI